MKMQEHVGRTKVKDARDWIRELAKAGWKQHSITTWQAPCGCYFRGPFRAWTEMNGTHLADHIASGMPTSPTSESRCG